MEGLLTNVSLCIGEGRDDFKMKRGSFSYKRKMKLSELKADEWRKKNGAYWLSFQGPRGKVVLKCEKKDADTYTIEADAERIRISFDCSPDLHFYGCGETYSEFDLKGQLVRNWVAEHQNSRRIGNKLIRQKILGRNYKRKLPFGKYESYYVEPAFTFLEEKDGCLKDPSFFFIDTDRYAEIDLRTPGRITLDLEEPCSFTILRARTFEELSEKIADLLGHGLKLPDWIYDGVILGIQKGPEVIEKKIEKAREHKVKINGVWSQDWCGCRKTGFGYQVMWNWEYDKELYHDLPSYIKKWKSEGIRFLGYINPFLAIEKDIYKEASSRGYCVKDKEGKDYLVTITTFPAAMIDFTNPDAYEFYKDLIKKNMIGIGMSGWMADFGEYLPPDAVLCNGDAASLHNEWPAIWAKLNREAIEECGKEDECFFFTRAGYTGSIGNSTMMWTGDQHVDWSVDDGIPSVIPASLSLAMSGFGIAHSDVGGYTTFGKEMARSKELLMRWEEMNVFSPLFRSHEGNQPVNDIQFDNDDELLDHLGKCSREHTALKPYLKELETDFREKGIPVMRPLFYHYPEKRFVNEKSEYLLGREVLVAPVLEPGENKRQVEFPEGSWINVWTGEKINLFSKECSGPVGKIPVFVRDTEKGRKIREDILRA